MPHLGRWLVIETLPPLGNFADHIFLIAWNLFNRNPPVCPQESCTLVYDRAKCSVSIHNFSGFQERHVKVLKVMSVPTYDLEMHFNFIKDV